uniref:ZP domain-containing protein n=1 Tax=Panagrolaimus sp. JU765 TaxID=591449 RepID=A0AC34QGU6_9BILA
MGLPEITCNPDTIEMKFKTKKRFNGKIYVQGHYNDPNCRVDYSNGKASEPIKLRHGDCDMNRQRMANSTTCITIFNRFGYQFSSSFCYQT